jgi:uncharacterized membrane protein (DUF106 family)
VHGFVAVSKAKEIVEREASRVAQRRAIDAKAAEIVRQKAQEFEEKQKALSKKQADGSQRRLLRLKHQRSTFLIWVPC